MEECEFCGTETDRTLKTGVSAYPACIECIERYQEIAFHYSDQSIAECLHTLREVVQNTLEIQFQIALQYA